MHGIFIPLFPFKLIPASLYRSPAAESIFSEADKYIISLSPDGFMSDHNKIYVLHAYDEWFVSRGKT